MLTLLAAMESSYLSPLVSLLRRQTIPETEKRPEAHGGGRWDNLESGEEGRYAVVASYLRRVGRNGKTSVLDVGCGPGILQPYLAVHGYGRYVGVDFNPDNVTKARARTDEKTGFELADAAAYQPRGTYDLIIFNEMLYFMDDPLGCVRRYMQRLEPGGLVVVSITVAYPTMDLIRALRAHLPVIDENIVVNRVGFGWVIQAIRADG
jgi:2-polyprenyl-3-methyl-5-hydroxy-6-metoxy-1,4-benzoquinol methylase